MVRIACIGGGSGGHILPIVILHESLKNQPNVECVWIGERGGMDEKKAEEHHIEFYPIQGVKFRRHFSLRNLLQPYFFARAIWQSYRVLRQIDPTAIFCKGGGVAFPVGVCAWLMRIPLYVHESDTVPGLTNRVVGFFAKRVFLGFESASVYFGKTPTEYVGQWVDPIFTEYMEKYPYTPQNDEYSTRVVVQCGGLGSTMIFQQLLDCVEKFTHIHFTVALGTLNEHFYDAFKSHPNVYVKKWFFHEELAEAYAHADVALVRAAATTLAECELFGLRIIMVPLGISSFNHQHINAVEYQKKNPEHVLLEESRLPDLGKVIASLQDFRKTGYGSVSATALERLTQVLLAEPTRRDS